MDFDFVYGISVDTREKPTANLRELTRIAFSLRSAALLRLIACAGIAPFLEKSTSLKLVRRLKSLWLLDKCYRKNPRAGFSVVSLFFRLHKKRSFG